MSRALILAIAITCVTSLGQADVPLAPVGMWSGRIGSHMTGVALAVDGPDADSTNVDLLATPATITVGSQAIPKQSAVIKAILYWGGTQAQPGGPLSSSPDNSVTLTLPNRMSNLINADTCHGSDGGAASYDMWLCRADVTQFIVASGTPLVGSYVIDEYTGLIANNSSDNASASLLLVFSAPTLPHRTVAVNDGLMTVSNRSTGIEMSGFSVADPADGELTWYTMEGDVGGTGVEQVTAEGFPNGALATLSDAVNPVANPMNHTINTTIPVQTNTLGLDIDRFQIDTALAPGDTSIHMTYTTGNDKWWIAVNLLQVGSADTCPADIDDSGNVNVNDLLAVINSWGPCANPANCPADINGDDIVNVNDLLAVINSWGACP